MGKVIDINDLFLYREAVKRLKGKGIEYDRQQLLNDRKLCMEIIELINFNQN